jgi:hypothetical protein
MNRHFAMMPSRLHHSLLVIGFVETSMAMPLQLKTRGNCGAIKRHTIIREKSQTKYTKQKNPLRHATPAKHLNHKICLNYASIQMLIKQ